jgi:hypothetical protein
MARDYEGGYDLGDVISAVESLGNESVSAINEVRDAVRNQHHSTYSSVLWLVVGYFLIGGWISDGWESKFRYSMYYGTTSEHTTVNKKPHDCDFFKAPIGSKECHFDKDVTVTETKVGNDTGTGKPVVSYDGGKTWAWNDGATRAVPHTEVYVTYTKIENE